MISTFPSRPLHSLAHLESRDDLFCVLLQDCRGTHNFPSDRPSLRFYRSLRAVKVLLAALRSTLTVLAPRRSGSLSVGVGKAVCSILIIAQRISGRTKFVEALGRFDSFEYFLRHWPTCPSFNEMSEQDLPPASFAPIG
jgi:hypothetical protein